MAFRHHREHHEPRGDHRIDHGEGQDREADAGARLGGAIDIARRTAACASQRAATARRAAGRWRRLRPDGGCASIAASSLPRSAPARCRSDRRPGPRSSAAIASAAGGCTIVGGRSGRRSSASYCVASAGRSCRCRRASPWMRAGLSSVAHSARSAAMASRSRRTSPRILATRSARSVDSNLIS